ncbi:M16 family metallopeptidase [sulfur-oxidizing endosymbiont of Gigantopelta aegis]|uniref:M16 family metallopeptidase n=1 Tax=sulfur-oxidizing endosymbiont of Gigantopelta aegis TaxID=2794934 RepID=UPI0018DDF2BD|nr:pitrilysin family protein [sulfur-oxidizing endosymbiont of Gigantopelta aegis]
MSVSTLQANETKEETKELKENTENAQQRVKVGKITQWSTQNGMKVLYQQADSLPMIDFRLIFDAGAARDGSFKSADGEVLAGLAKLTNGLIFEGTDKLSANDIAEQFASLGVEYGNGSYRDMAIVNLRTLSYEKQRNQALDLLTDILANTVFPEEALQRESARMLVALDYADQTPSKKASRYFYQSLYKTHPYGTPPDGTRDSLKAIQRSDLQAYYKQFYVAKNVVLAIVGDLTEAQAKSYAEQISQAMPAGEKVAALPSAEQNEKAMVIRENHPSTQTTVLMGQPILKRGDEDYYALYVGNHILGGSGFNARLMKELRVKRGLTYSIGSYLVAMHAQGPYQFSFTTKQSSTEEAIQLVAENLQQFITDGPSEEELKDAKLNITGSFPLKLASNKSIVETLAVIGFYDLPLDYMDNYNAHIEAVTLAQIKSAYKRRVHPNKMVTVIVGPDVENSKIEDSKTSGHEQAKKDAGLEASKG